MASIHSSSTTPLTPSTPRQFADLLGEMSVRGSAVSTVGGGTKLGFGNPLCRDTERVSTKGLDRILAYEPDDMTISVEAGATIGDVWRELAPRGQTIPIDVPAPDSETIGGLIATGLCGPRRYGSGSLRDALIGIQAAYPDATLGNAGGMVVKNVSGFDLMRMHLGALGTLGIIVSANFKVIPAARAEATVLIQRETVDELEPDRLVIGMGRIRPVAYEVQRNAYGWREAIRIEGRPATVDQMARELADSLGHAATLPADESKAFWRDYVAAEALTNVANQLVMQMRGKPSATLDTLREALAALEPAGAVLEDIRISPGLGTVRIVASIGEGAHDTTSEAILALRKAGSNVLLLTAPTPIHSTVDVFGTPDATLELMRRLKRQFDPRSVLNPGRVIPEL